MSTLAADALLLPQLRSATRDLHVRTEELPLMARLLAPDLGAAEYRRVLEKMWGFYAPLEARLADVSGSGYSFEPRTPRLESDLRHFGIEPDTLPRCTSLPDVSTEARTWGAFYVLEGAALGGRVILKHISRTQGVTAEEGGAFFAGGGPPGSGWKAFVAAAEEASDAPETQAEVVEAAVETFSSLYHWLQA